MQASVGTRAQLATSAEEDNDASETLPEVLPFPFKEEASSKIWQSHLLHDTVGDVSNVSGPHGLSSSADRNLTAASNKYYYQELIESFQEPGFIKHMSLFLQGRDDVQDVHGTVKHHLPLVVQCKRCAPLFAMGIGQGFFAVSGPETFDVHAAGCIVVSVSNLAVLVHVGGTGSTRNMRIRTVIFLSFRMTFQVYTVVAFVVASTNRIVRSRVTAGIVAWHRPIFVTPSA